MQKPSSNLIFTQQSGLISPFQHPVGLNHRRGIGVPHRRTFRALAGAGIDTNEAAALDPKPCDEIPAPPFQHENQGQPQLVGRPMSGHVKAVGKTYESRKKSWGSRLRLRVTNPDGESKSCQFDFRFPCLSLEQ